jgi:hypothetical protein
MLLATLGRLRGKSSISSTDTSMSAGSDSAYNASPRSSDTVSSMASSSRSSSKRYSNNMFGSGRFRDHSYLRSVHQQQQHRNGSGRSVLSTSSVASGRKEEGGTVDVSMIERTLSHALPRDQLHRASMALDEVIREIEEEAEGEEDGDGDDDKVLVPRSPVDGRGIVVRDCMRRTCLRVSEHVCSVRKRCQARARACMILRPALRFLSTIRYRTRATHPSRLPPIPAQTTPRPRRVYQAIYLGCHVR